MHFVFSGLDRYVKNYMSFLKRSDNANTFVFASIVWGCALMQLGGAHVLCNLGPILTQCGDQFVCIPSIVTRVKFQNE